MRIFAPSQRGLDTFVLAVALGLLGCFPQTVLAKAARLSTKDLIGTWAVLHDNSPADACRSDFISDFRRSGLYEGYFEQGTWSLAGDLLTIKITRTNYDTGGEGPMRRLSKPEIRRTRVARIGYGQLRMDKDTAVRC